MPCQNCGSDSINPCSCSNGYNAFTVSTTNVTIANPMTIPVSNTGQYIGVWARVGQPIFIQGYGTYRVTASTATSITVAFPTGTYIGGATYIPGTTDYANTGTIISGAKISPGGEKGDTGNNGIIGSLIDAFHGAASSTALYPIFTPVRTVSIPANTLSVIGDSLRIYSKWYLNSALDAGETGYIQFTFGGTLLSTPLTLVTLYPLSIIEIVMTYVDDTTVDVRISIEMIPAYVNYVTEAAISALTTSALITLENIGVAVGSMSANQNLVFEGAISSVIPGREMKLGYDTIEILKKI